MKNKTKLSKRIVAFFVFMIFTFNSFAAVVSDNDGAAFVTKAEFDTLRGNFQNQIDDYNISIDSKIDGAIASYLAGMQLIDTETVELPNASFNKITFMNYMPDNEFQFSGIDLQTSILGNQGVFTFYIFDNDKYIKTGDEDKRLICDAGTESATEPSYITWKGRSNNYIDNVQLTRIVQTRNTPYFIESGIWAPIYFNKLVAGYYSDLSNASSSLWLGNYYWNNGGCTTLDFSSYWAQTNVFTGKYDSLSHEHIIHWNTISNLRFTDPNWDHTINYLPDAAFNIQALKSKMTLSGYYAGAEYSSTGRARANTALNTSYYYTGGNGATDTTTRTVSVGLLNTVYDSKHIRQNGDFKQKVDQTNFVVSNLDLRQGFVCLAAKSGDKITWKPSFKNCIVDGVSTNFDVDVKLSIIAFGEGNSVADNSKVIKPVGVSTDYLKTSGGTCEFKFIMPEDGVVYCKCWPDNTTIRDTKKWSFDLDLSSCDSYSRVKAK